jgi:RNA polymerase sigma-70 factor (ECF subfamily)
MDIAAAFERHADMLYRVCITYMRGAADAEDAVQDTFMRLIKAEKRFDSAEHEKAWLLRVAGNVCKDALRRNKYRSADDLDDFRDIAADNRADFETDDTLTAVMTLPERYKTAVYLHYYEGYKTEEIAQMLKKPHSTIRNHLSEARKILQTMLNDADEV